MPAKQLQGNYEKKKGNNTKILKKTRPNRKKNARIKPKLKIKNYLKKNKKK